ncbi:MAG: hemerythrin domain-containing protein [Tatlockia sp.]|nr:hemerythrin domain-containing protein [Tatlockia sp.]
MDICEYLKGDHEVVSLLFKQYKKAPAKRKPEFAQLIADELLAHAKAEQETFYKVLEQYPEIKDKALHGWKEHQEIEDLIKSFDNQKISEESLTEKIEKLEELVKHHVSEEESALFRKAKKVITIGQSRALKELMHDLKHQYKLKRLKERSDI